MRAGLTEKWSNGCVEGFVHKLKLLKRLGYERAGFELLRVRRMEEAGITTGYHAQVSAEKVGLPLTAFVRIEVPGVNHERVEALVVELPEVLECHRATGADCFLMKVALASTEHLKEVLDKLGVWGSPVTSIVISSPVPERGIERMPNRPDEDTG